MESQEGAAPIPSAPEQPAALPPEAPKTVVGGRTEFSASLESFQGPLDLLLYLIKENEVEITEIPIAKILQQYLGYLDAAAQWDLHLAGEFLVMAATLMEIKSRELLPVQEPLPGDEIIEDPRSELVRQLLRYRQLKDHARALEALHEAWSKRRARGLYDDIPEPESGHADATPLVDFDVYALFAAFEKLQRSVLAQVPRSVSYEGETLEQKVERIEAILKDRPFARFEELVFDLSSRSDIAMTFVALLELVRRRMIRLLQDKDFADIGVKVQTKEEAEALAKDEAAVADQVVDVAMRERAEREAKLAAEAAAMGVSVDRLPWKKRRAALARPKFEGLVRPEDLEEIDAEEAEIARRIDAILAAADAITQRFEEARTGEQAAGAAASAEGAPLPSPSEEKPLTEADLEPKPEEKPPKEESSEGKSPG